MRQAALNPSLPFSTVSNRYVSQGARLGGVGLTSLRFAGQQSSLQALAQYIDHTKLTYKEGENPREAIKTLCQEAENNNFYAVCVRPDMVPLAKTRLKGTGVKVATVIGFPQGKSSLANEKALATIGDVSLQTKLAEARQAVKDGADELDLVMNVRQFLLEASRPVATATCREFAEIKAVAGERPVKVIIETDLLTSDEIKKATQACIQAEVDMVKTSTGMLDGGKGATVEDVRLIQQTLAAAGAANRVGIKASGGIRNQTDAQILVQAGATRLGTSQGVAIVQGNQGQQGY